MAKQSHIPSRSPALDRAIKKHQAAHEAFTNSPDDDCRDASRKEDATRRAIALRSFKDDAEFLAALRYLVTAEAQIWETVGDADEFGATLACVAKYFIGDRATQPRSLTR